MKRKFSLLILCFFVFTSLPSKAGILEDLRERYAKISSVEAQFTQVTTLGVKRKMEYRGKVYIIPGKSRWEYESPSPQTVITNGDLFLLLDPINNEAIKGRVEKEAIVTRGPFFSLIEEITKYYDVTEGKLEGEKILKLIPKNSKASIQRVIIHFDPKTLYINRVESLDSLGNLNMVTFQNIKVNQLISPKLFEMRIPQGMKVTRP